MAHDPGTWVLDVGEKPDGMAFVMGRNPIAMRCGYVLETFGRANRKYIVGFVSSATTVTCQPLGPQTAFSDAFRYFRL